MCEEMKKLRKWLDDHKIKWWDNSYTYDDDFYIHRTKFVAKGKEFSVINGVGTYGGMVTIGCKNQGLLEMWIVGEGEPEGCLTAHEAVNKICDAIGIIDTSLWV